METTKLKIITTEHFSGYMLKNIKQVFDEKTYNKFQDWMFGETMQIYKNEPVVSKIHLDSFLRDRPPLLL